MKQKYLNQKFCASLFCLYPSIPGSSHTPGGASGGLTGGLQVCQSPERWPGATLNPTLHSQLILGRRSPWASKH